MCQILVVCAILSQNIVSTSRQKRGDNPVYYLPRWSGRNDVGSFEFPNKVDVLINVRACVSKRCDGIPIVSLIYDVPKVLLNLSKGNISDYVLGWQSGL